MDFRFSEFPNCTIKFYGKVELFIGLHHSTVQALALSAGLLLFTKKITENVLPSKNVGHLAKSIVNQITHKNDDCTIEH